MSEALHVERHEVRTHDGWSLVLYRGVRPGRVAGPPVMFVPGFGMNSFIFRYHPRGGSFLEHLLDAGLDPWSVDLRGHTSTRPRAGEPLAPSLTDFAFADLPAAFDFVARQTGNDRVSAIGCSLGGTLLYGYASTIGRDRIDRLVTIGTPLRWTERPFVVDAFARLIPLFPPIPIRGTRSLARLGLPLASRIAPKALSVYLNPTLTHTRPTTELVRTIEDPHPRINRQLAKWVKAGDLKLGQVNVTEALRAMDRPLLVIAGAGDRICPPSAAIAALDHAAGPKSSLVVGSDQEPVAHADLFIADLAPARIFTPVARFLTARDDP